MVWYCLLGFLDRSQGYFHWWLFGLLDTYKSYLQTNETIKQTKKRTKERKQMNEPANWRAIEWTTNEQTKKESRESTNKWKNEWINAWCVQGYPGGAEVLQHLRRGGEALRLSRLQDLLRWDPLVEGIPPVIGTVPRDSAFCVWLFWFLFLSLLPRDIQRLPTTFFPLVLRKEYFDSPQRDSYTVHYI
jgi:hypothetical protein